MTEVKPFWHVTFLFHSALPFVFLLPSSLSICLELFLQPYPQEKLEDELLFSHEIINILNPAWAEVPFHFTWNSKMTLSMHSWVLIAQNESGTWFPPHPVSSNINIRGWWEGGGALILGYLEKSVGIHYFPSNRLAYIFSDTVLMVD